MESGAEKCAILIIKSRKRQMGERIEVPNQERIRRFREKKNYKYLGILKGDTIKQAEMREKITKEYLSLTGKLLETKLCSRNLIMDSPPSLNESSWCYG